jgi:hypothetical protein
MATLKSPAKLRDRRKIVDQRSCRPLTTAPARTRPRRANSEHNRPDMEKSFTELVKQSLAVLNETGDCLNSKSLVYVPQYGP